MLWVFLGLALIAIVWAAVANQAPRRRDDIGEIFERQRAKRDLVRAEIDRIWGMAEQMFVHASRQGAESDAASCRAALDNILRGKLLTARDTRTRMVHVVTSPIWLRIVCKDRPTTASAIVHECWRLGADRYAIESLSVADFDTAIAAFTADSKRVFSQLEARRDIDYVNNIVP